MSAQGPARLELGGPRKDATALEPRPLGQAMLRGFLCKCPHCGSAPLFNGFLRSVDHCAACGEAYHHHRADDLPPYLTIFIVGHIVIALFMGVEEIGDLPLWAHLAIWVPLTSIFTLGLLRPIKGATIGLQWALRMHGFSGRGEDEPQDH
uniref:Zinc-finger protein n=2 Tax=Aureimonas frigidaquae TaxID=424757 RepID=A0A0N7KY72_9HYPH|nr:hypothetical protein [Aureimonas frigidaquae]